ncbi:MocR-like transcription factor YczR [Saccharothrix coeruleofusca]|uniref:GntR family transcriptional regulator n=1 Tax=Saccharothrix coeruleofusca TaxID=33919 RepID=A0A918ALC6_9PSEU|nr:PLP-dependent aminotransferase family protein [Saccharothrix coeruleofusca]MBP2339591.1 DNA-binding transcriptional MocR family regulator [Saccharothrix coeruleofusca]GGP56607.1 GntR family transcriptional regulator [Saccharothrix coeruleofusca]
MELGFPASGRISGFRLARLLGEWRRRGARQGSADLAAAIRMLILDGRLPAGTRLPAEREMADALPVSRTMITAALDQLRAEGLVASRRGAGTWVSLPTGHLGIAPDTPLVGHSMVDFARAAPPAIPSTLAAFDAVRLRMPERLADHGYYEHGLPDLRQRIAARYEARGLPTSPEQILVTSGAQHALALVLRLLTGPGDRVLVEQPSYPNALDAIKAVSAIPVPVAMTETGWDLPGIAAALRQAAPRMAYLVVDFHNPTAHRMGAAERAELVELARRARTPLVVDETVVELDLDGDPLDGPPPVASFGEDLVITLGSASKSHWGGLRIGWIRATPEVVHRLVAGRTALDLGSAVLDQMVLAELLADPEPALAARRAQLADQRDVLMAGLREHCPRWRFRRPSGGLSVWCELDAPVSTRVAVVAQNHGIRLVPGSRFGAHGGFERWLRLPYVLPAEVLRDAVRRLGLVAATVSGTGVEGDAEVDVPVA